ncbi:MAG: Bax inhibitor-1 family protein [Actinobacteria bacterium]|nr:Bax inhibitor-1 family protein [Actinomycetota bacterium]
MPVGTQSADVRLQFLRRVYAHLGGAVAAFVLLEMFLFSSGLAMAIAELVFGTSWLLILGGFVLISWLSSSVAHRATTPAAQYGAYAALIVAEALLFAPMLVIASLQAPGVISQAAMLSVVAFAGLTLVALTSGRDFSVLGALLKWGGIVALVLIVAAVLFGLGLGTWFSVAMIAYAGGAILYDTSRVLRTYPADREVAASMQLFASLALLFWYVLRLLSRN